MNKNYKKHLKEVSKLTKEEKLSIISETEDKLLHLTALVLLGKEQELNSELDVDDWECDISPIIFKY